MAFYDDDGAANNGFPRRSLHAWEGHLLHQAGYPCPPDTRPPGGGWRLSAGGVPIPPPPRGHALDVAIEEARMTMTDEERADPRHHPDNYTRRNSYFLQRWERELAAYDGPPPPPARNNAAGRRRWWSAPERTLANVLAHIEGGNYPVLTMPPLSASRASASRRRGSVWQPRRMAASSSSSGSASRSSLAPVKREEATSPSTPVRVKKEPASPPATRGRSSGALVIREQPSAPQSGRKKTKKEAAASQLAEEEAKRAEEAAMAEAIARSLADMQEEKRADDAALDWARRDWQRQEAEQQRRLLDLAAARQLAARAAPTANDDVARYRRPATPPSGVAVPVVDLESSDDDWYKPSPGWGDAGQGSSSQAAQPKVPKVEDDGSDDDYTVFYRRMGM